MFRNLNITILLVIMTVLAVPSMGKDETESAVPQVSGNHNTINIPSQGKGEWDRWTLWPGESCTYEGVTLTWNIDPNDQLSCRYGGTLIFDASPESRLEFPIFDINDIIEYKGYYGYDPDGTEYILCTGRSIYYVAGSVFQIRYDCKAKNAEGFPDSTDLRTRDGNIDNILIPSLEFNARRQSNVPIMSSAPYENRELYLSQTIPITLNNWKMGVCESPRQYPDGSEYYELTILNSETKESFTLPLVKDATRKFGRFEITVAFFTPRTGSAQLKVNADADYTIRGLDTYIDGYSTKPPESAPFGEFLENLGQKYGFTVEWIPYPGHPESIEYARNRWSPNEFRLDSGIIKDLLIGSLKENYILDCQDPTVLKIQWKDYNLVIAKEEEYARNIAKDKEKEEIWKAKVQARTEQFEKEYALQTKAFPLSRLSATSIKLPIEAEIKCYYILEAGYPDSTLAKAGLTIIKKEKDFVVCSTPMGGLPDNIDEKTGFAISRYVIGNIKERILSDEKSNTLIVTATTGTLDKIAKIISDMEGMIADAAQKGPADVYRVEMVLLQGLDGAASRIEAATATPAPAAAKIEDASAMARYGISKEDLEIFGFTSVKEMGKAVVNLLGVPDETGKAEATLSDSFSCELEFRDFMEPYLVLTGKLKDQEGKALLSNSVYLQAGKPSVLGLTNLHQAVILVLRLHGGQ